MTPAEVANRMLRALQARAERSGLLAARSVPEPDLGVSSNPWHRCDPGIQPQPYVAAADRICSGLLDVFALRGAQIGSPPRWNRDPRTGIEAPLAFGKELDYRDTNLVGDIKYLWEPNRHQHLVTLAQAFALTHSKKYLDAIEEHLDSWYLRLSRRLRPELGQRARGGAAPDQLGRRVAARGPSSARKKS